MDANINLDIQELAVKNDRWIIELLYESRYAENKVVEPKNYSKVIELSGNDFGSLLTISATSIPGDTKRCLITGIDGGTYLYIANNQGESQSVKLLGESLILSLGFTFFSFNLDRQEIEWKLRPDLAEVFGFYDLQDDYLLRGELEIHRIDNSGNIKWSYSGRDIWVSIDGKEEVKIEDDKIKLTDFEGNRYVIDFNGQTLEDSKSKKKWWSFWK